MSDCVQSFSTNTPKAPFPISDSLPGRMSKLHISDKIVTIQSAMNRSISFKTLWYNGG